MDSIANGWGTAATQRSQIRVRVCVCCPSEIGSSVNVLSRARRKEPLQYVAEHGTRQGQIPRLSGVSTTTAEALKREKTNKPRLYTDASDTEQRVADSNAHRWKTIHRPGNWFRTYGGQGYNHRNVRSGTTAAAIGYQFGRQRTNLDSGHTLAGQ